MAWPLLIVRCRTRLLPAGSKERFCRARTLIFITVIRGVHRSAPFRTLGWRVARPPSSGEPTPPLLRDDPDHIRQVTMSLAPALLDGEKSEPSRFPNGVLNHSAAHAGPGCNLIDAPLTEAVLAHLVPNDPQHRQLAHRELAGQRRRHRTGRGQVSAPGNRDGALRGTLESSGWEDRGAAGWDAHRLDLAP